MNAGETQLMACGARGQSWGPYWNSTMPMVGLRCTGGYAKLREGPLHTFPIVYITTNNSAAVFQYAHARSARRSAYIICVDSVTCVPPRSNLRICLVAFSGPPRVGCPSSRACHLLTPPLACHQGLADKIIQAMLVSWNLYSGHADASAANDFNHARCRLFPFSPQPFLLPRTPRIPPPPAPASHCLLPATGSIPFPSFAVLMSSVSSSNFGGRNRIALPLCRKTLLGS